MSGFPSFTAVTGTYVTEPISVVTFNNEWYVPAAKPPGRSDSGSVTPAPASYTGNACDHAPAGKSTAAVPACPTTRSLNTEIRADIGTSLLPAVTCSSVNDSGCVARFRNISRHGVVPDR